jgi:hypothetical protein
MPGLGELQHHLAASDEALQGVACTKFTQDTSVVQVVDNDLEYYRIDIDDRGSLDQTSTQDGACLQRESRDVDGASGPAHADVDAVAA